MPPPGWRRGRSATHPAVAPSVHGSGHPHQVLQVGTVGGTVGCWSRPGRGVGLPALGVAVGMAGVDSTAGPHGGEGKCEYQEEGMRGMGVSLTWRKENGEWYTDSEAHG